VIWRDPLVRLIVAALVLAALLPATGAGRTVAQAIANVAIFLLFLLYGLRLSRREVLAGLGNVRLLVPLVLWVFGVMAAAGWLTWSLTGAVLPAELALGFLFLGALPSTVQSATAYTSVAGGNVASAVVAAALVNILAVFVSAPLFALLAGGAAPPFEGATLVKVLTLLLLPFVLGQALQRWFGAWVTRNKPVVTAMDRGSIAIAVYVAFSGAVEQGIWSKIAASAWLWLGLACAVLLVFGYGGSWLLGKALRLPRGERITMLFAGAQKSVAMGAPLAMVLFPPAAAGIVLLPLIVYHLAQMLVAAPLAARLKAQCA
jgi:solute carrier family 10 (sodium/bile acid cotransporter), member 7